ncbi:hypothetical protein MCOR25_005219 [Pyricularia grisea]|nr:hypothetical protein MCOR25_005219 [Pyricularia grisea]
MVHSARPTLRAPLGLLPYSSSAESVGPSATIPDKELVESWNTSWQKTRDRIP